MWQNKTTDFSQRSACFLCIIYTAIFRRNILFLVRQKLRYFYTQPLRFCSIHHCLRLNLSSHLAMECQAAAILRFSFGNVISSRLLPGGRYLSIHQGSASAVSLHEMFAPDVYKKAVADKLLPGFHIVNVF